MEHNQLRPNGEFDLIGVGLGPANMSLAALLSGVSDINVRFFDGKTSPEWHTGILFGHAEMQTSFLEDLVTPVDPTNKLSFLSFLSDTGRIYSFLCRNTTTISRLEFQSYLKWAASKLDCASFGENVREINFSEGSFQIHTAKGLYRSKSISIGVGKALHLPKWAHGNISKSCFHSSGFLQAGLSFEGKRVAVVGGGQSAVDVMLALLGQEYGLPSEIHWVTRRGNLLGMDQSPFVNEFFTPQYVRHFFNHAGGRRVQLLSEQKLFGDGVTMESLEALYREVYLKSFVEEPGTSIAIYPDCEVTDLSRFGSGHQLRFINQATRAHSDVHADIVVLCTGYRHFIPEFLQPLKSRISFASTNRYRLTDTYRVVWDGPEDNAIYAQNAGIQSHGVVDSQLCLISWRSAVISNDLLKHRKYCVTPPQGFMRWDGNAGPPLSGEALFPSLAGAEREPPKSPVLYLSRGQ